MSDSDAVPWIQFGPEPTGQWAWDRPEFRQQLRIGTVLETYDCGYIRVEEITPDGVVARAPSSDRHLWTWADLQRLECTVYDESEDEHRPVGGVVVSERGGKLDIHRIRDLSPVNSGRSLAPDFDVRLLDAEIAVELLDVIPSTWPAAHLHVRAVGNTHDLIFELTISKPGSTETVQPNKGLEEALRMLHQLSGRRQEVPWRQLYFAVHRTDVQHCRYEVQFSYP
jgi:hypothetical protein